MTIVSLVKPAGFKAFLTSSLLVLVTAGGFPPAQAADFSTVPSANYRLDPTHAYIALSYNHLGLSRPIVHFRRFTVDLQLDAAEPARSTLAVTIDANSVDSGVALFDEHLRDTDYFDVANHPEIQFRATDITLKDSDEAVITGTLSIKGITREVQLQARLNGAGPHPMRPGTAVLGFSAETQLLRSEFGMPSAIPFVSDEVELRIEVELLQVPAPE